MSVRVLFKELLALHFSPTRPHADDWTDHPVIVLLVREIERVRGDGSVHPEVDAFYSAIFFLLGVYGVLTTTDSADKRDTMLTKLVAHRRAGPCNHQGGLKWTGSGRSFAMSQRGAGPDCHLVLVLDVLQPRHVLRHRSTCRSLRRTRDGGRTQLRSDRCRPQRPAARGCASGDRSASGVQPEFDA